MGRSCPLPTPPLAQTLDVTPVGWDVFGVGHGMEYTACVQTAPNTIGEGWPEREGMDNIEKKQHARREEETEGEENYNTKASDITDFLQPTPTERLALVLELREKCQEFFREVNNIFIPHHLPRR